MKQFFTFIFAIMAISAIKAQTNVVQNEGFEADVTTFTVSPDGTANELRRISGHTSTITETQNPTSAAVSVEDGMWVRKGMNSGAIKTNVITSDKHTGTSSLHLLNPTTSAWYHCFAQERIDAGLDNTQKYGFRFWAKLDDQTSGEKQLVVRILDKTGVALATKYPKFNQNAWTEYESGLIDFSGVTGDYSTVYFGIGLGGDGNYAGVIIDDIQLLIESAYTKVESINEKPITLITYHNGFEVGNLAKGEPIKIYGMTGKLLSSATTDAETIFFSFDKGFYIVLINGKAIKALIK